MKIAVLWITLTGYLNSCLRELAAHPDVELFVAHAPTDSDAPFDEQPYAWISRRLAWHTESELKALGPRLEEFNPDVILFAGWAVPAYRELAKTWRGRALRIMTMDNCWRGTAKQWVGTLAAPLTVRRLADAIWVPGERQAMFARRMGFRQRQILRGSYSCDHPIFCRVFSERVRTGAPLPRAFLFVGRLVPEKGIDTLLSAYRAYRDRSAEPWPLICCGAGPLSSAVEREPGVVARGFVQPEDLAKELAQAGCLVLPSSFEPWALVVHEAAAAGLLVLASEAVGSVPHLVQDGYNGFVFGVNDAAGLTELMGRVSQLDEHKLDAMSAASNALSYQFTPVNWADKVLEFSADAMRSRGVPLR